jgi:hypothetical protein
MNCPNCEGKMIHGGDHDEEDADGRNYISSNLSCPDCDTFMLIYTPLEEYSNIPPPSTRI